MLIAVIVAVPSRADPRVIVSASADPDYTRKKYAGDQPKSESYVVMQGHFFEGHSVDKSIERMTFRHMVEIFAPELSRRRYLPAKSAKEADLLIVVHWGTTEPRMTFMDMTARTSSTLDTSVSDLERQIRLAAIAGANDAIAGLMTELVDDGARQKQEDVIAQLSDQVAVEQSSANIAQLLGYTKELNQLSRGSGTTAEEYTLRTDLRQERYFIILKAYDLRSPATPGQPRRSVWTMHLNMSSPGNNFEGAVARMSFAAVNYLGRTTDHVATIVPKQPETKVEIGPLTIINENEPAKK